MTKEQIELRDAWRTIYSILTQTGYDILYQDEITKVVNAIRKEIGLDQSKRIDVNGVYLRNNGIFECGCGSLQSFAEDLYNYICPLLYGTIKAKFNGKVFVVDKYDTVDIIIEKCKNAQYEEWNKYEILYWDIKW